MPEKNWNQIVTELRGLRNLMVVLAKEDDTDADFLDLVDLIEQVADGVESRYRRSAD